MVFRLYDITALKNNGLNMFYEIQLINCDNNVVIFRFETNHVKWFLFNIKNIVYNDNFINNINDTNNIKSIIDYMRSNYCSFHIGFENSLPVTVYGNDKYETLLNVNSIFNDEINYFEFEDRILKAYSKNNMYLIQDKYLLKNNYNDFMYVEELF